MDLFPLFLFRFFGSPLSDFAVFLHNITSPGIAVARLANRADIDHRLFRAELILVANFIWAHKVHAFREYTRHMGVALKANALTQRDTAALFWVCKSVLHESHIL